MGATIQFFDDGPPEPPRQWSWAPPVWDRPSEGTLPVLVPVNELVFQGAEATVAVESLHAYPNGFTVDLFVMTDPHREPGTFHPLRNSVQFPRLGVRFADGRTAGHEHRSGNPADLAKDERGVPVDPVLRFTGGGGGPHGFHFGAWVHPLPPVGPLEIFVALAADDWEEHRVEVDGGAVRAAAAGARVIWT
jgi:hypothetical protein